MGDRLNAVGGTILGVILYKKYFSRTSILTADEKIELAIAQDASGSAAEAKALEDKAVEAAQQARREGQKNRTADNMRVAAKNAYDAGKITLDQYNMILDQADAVEAAT